MRSKALIELRSQQFQQTEQPLQTRNDRKAFTLGHVSLPIFVVEKRARSRGPNQEKDEWNRENQG